MKRYVSRQNQHIDARQHNGRSTPKKITPEIAQYLLSQETLQRQSGQTLDQRSKDLEVLFGVRLAKQSLQAFYWKHHVKYGVSSYQYVQAMNENSFHQVRMFAVKLAKMIAEGDFNMVYFDEASFNLWMRHRRTWGMQGRPVKMLLNKIRGKGVTVFGAIGSLMPKPLFVMERTTNSHNFMRFLRRLRKLFEHDDRTIHLILDNHRGHHTLEAKAYAVKKKIALHFMPPYSPELNAIEPLWSVLKRDFKSRMLDHRVDRVEEPFFRQIL